MITLVLAALVAGAPVDACASLRVDAGYSVRIEEAKQLVGNLFLHPSGAVVSTWLLGPPREYWIRQWAEPIEREGAILNVWGQVGEVLPDGRLVVQRMVGEGAYGKLIFDVADWGGGARVIAQAQNLDLLGVAAVACGLAPSEVKRGDVHDSVTCVGGRLVAERVVSRSASGDNTDGQFLWDQGAWRQIATSSHSLLPSGIGVSRLLLSTRVEPAVLKALDSAGIPFLVLPFAYRRATCGPDSCWSVTQDGRLMALDLRAGSDGAWVEVGSGVAVGVITLRVASKARALLHHDACDSQVRYFQLPAPRTLRLESRDARPAGVR